MKIDTTKIEGYLDMTPEQKILALEAFDMNVDYTGYVKKELLERANTEAANYKRQLQEKMTDEERRKADENALLDQLRQENETLKREKSITEATSQYLAMGGFDEELAKATAEAQVDGKIDIVMANIKKGIENVKQQSVKEGLESLGDPAKGETGGTTMTREQFKRLSLAEKNKLALTNNSLYQQLSGHSTEI